MAVYKLDILRLNLCSSLHHFSAIATVVNVLGLSLTECLIALHNILDHSPVPRPPDVLTTGFHLSTMLGYTDQSKGACKEINPAWHLAPPPLLTVLHFCLVHGHVMHKNKMLQNRSLCLRMICSNRSGINCEQDLIRS